MVTNGGTPVNGLTDDPEITIRRTDTGAVAAGPSAMTDQGADGLYTFSFTPVAGLEYSFLIDADPLATNQVRRFERYYDGGFDNELNDLWNDHGLNPAIDKTITENTPGSDYDEQVLAPTSIDKAVTRVASVTTINRS